MDFYLHRENQFAQAVKRHRGSEIARWLTFFENKAPFSIIEKPVGTVVFKVVDFVGNGVVAYVRALNHALEQPVEIAAKGIVRVLRSELVCDRKKVCATGVLELQRSK